MLQDMFSESIFDNRNWKFIKSYNKIDLYEVNTGYPCFYKAEVVLKTGYYNNSVKALLDFSNYPKIFPGTIIFQNLKETNNGILFYCQLNFFPLKNRDYYIDAKYFESIDINNNRKWTLEWDPVNNAPEFSNPRSDKFKHVKNIYGRWTVQDLNRDEIKISVEYYNDWQVEANNDIKIALEKTTTINVLKNFLKYMK
jgi:hypothetical protein